MKITKIDELDAFLAALRKCEGDVYLRSQYGDRYNLKSVMSMYIGIGALLSEHGDELELFCDNKADEQYFFEFFSENQSVING